MAGTNEQDSGMSLSFLDVLSCGLGGTVLLFTILSSLSHQGDQSSTSRQGLSVKGERAVAAASNAATDAKAVALFMIRMRPVDGRTSPEKLSINLGSSPPHDATTAPRVTTWLKAGEELEACILIQDRSKPAMFDIGPEGASIEVTQEERTGTATAAAMTLTTAPGFDLRYDPGTGSFTATRGK